MPEFTADQAILVAKAAGLDVAPLEEQVRRQAEGHDAATLESRIRELETRLEAAQQPAPQQPHEQLAEALHNAQSKWTTLGELGGQDGQAA